MWIFPERESLVHSRWEELRVEKVATGVTDRTQVSMRYMEVENKSCTRRKSPLVLGSRTTMVLN